MRLPDDACPLCLDLGRCALREYKGDDTCARSGSCAYTGETDERVAASDGESDTGATG